MSGLSASLRSLFALLRSACAAAAMLVLLLHAAVAASPSADHLPLSADAVPAAAQLDSCPDSGSSDCSLQAAHGSCCEAGCSAMLAASLGRMAGSIASGRIDPADIDAKPGIAPEGLRRPPRSA